MRVRTIRDHSNAYPPVYLKTHGRIYEVPDEDAETLISNGYVEAADESSTGGLSGAGGQTAGAPEGDREERTAKGGKGRS